MIKKICSLFLAFITLTILTGCSSKTPLAKQAEILSRELSKKPADKYEENVEANNVFAHIHKMDKGELRQYYDRADSKFYDVYFVAVTNKSDKNIILSVSDTSLTAANEKKSIIGNDLNKLMKKGNEGVLSKTVKGMQVLFYGAISWGILVPVILATGESNPKQKTKEIYYQTTYDKGLKSIVLQPYYTTSGFLIIPDKPFQAYKSINLKFQKTQEFEYFDLEYPMNLTTDKLRKEKQKTQIKEAEQKRKQSQKEREEQIKLLKQQHKGL